MSRRVTGFVLSGVLAATAIAAGPAAAQDFKLRFAHYLGNSPFISVEQNFAKNVEERTKGRVKIEMSYAGALGKGNELLQLASRGAIDFAAAPPGYYADQLRYWKAFQIPFVFTSPKQAIEVAQTSLKELGPFKAELEKAGVIFLFQQLLGEYWLTGPNANCDTVEALKGKKLRSFGSDVPKLHSAIGAVPVTVGVTDVYEALQRGTLDYSYLNAGNVLSNRLYEPGKFNCGPIMTISGHLILMGKRSFDKLPKDLQDAVMDEAAKSQAEYLAFVEGHEKKAIEEIKKAGGTFKEFPAAELEKWRKATPDLLAAWAKDLEAKGDGANAAAVEKRWRELTAKK